MESAGRSLHFSKNSSKASKENLKYLKNLISLRLVGADLINTFSSSFPISKISSLVSTLTLYMSNNNDFKFWQIFSNFSNSEKCSSDGGNISDKYSIKGQF